MDDLDRRIVNLLQGGIPVSPRPYREAALELEIDEDVLLERLRSLLEDNVLSRMGPMFDAERLGGAFCLCALQVPRERFEEVAATVNAFEEVAHNYERSHHFNMWFVLATESVARIPAVIAAIEAATGLKVLDLPKLEEYFIGLRLDA